MDVCRLLVTWALLVLAHGQQLNMRYVDWFAVRPKHMFWARTVFRLTGVSSEQCAMECLSMRGRCLSFDFHKRTGSCFGRANGEDTLRSNKRLRNNDNYDFYVANMDRVYAALRFYRAPQNNAGVHPPTTKLEHPPIRPETRIVPDMRFVTSRENNRYIPRMRPTHTPIATASRRPVITTTTRRPMRATTTRRPVITTTTMRPIRTTTTRRPVITTPTRRPIRTTTTRRPVITTPTRRPIRTTTTIRPIRTTTRRRPVITTPTRRPIITTTTIRPIRTTTRRRPVITTTTIRPIRTTTRRRPVITTTTMRPIRTTTRRRPVITTPTRRPIRTTTTRRPVITTTTMRPIRTTTTTSPVITTTRKQYITARRLTTTNRPAPTTLHNNKSILLLTIKPPVSRYYESTFTPTRTSLTTHDYNRRTDNARISLTTENSALRSTISLATVPQATRGPENINNPTTKPFVTIPNITTEGQRTANEYFTKRQQTTLIPITEYFRKQQSSKRPEEPYQATNRTTTFSPIIESTTLYSIAQSAEPREIIHTTKEPTSVFPTTIFPSTFKLPDCQQSIGIESGEIFDSSFSASSHYPSYPAARARINDGYGWRPNYDDLIQYLQIDLGDDTTLTSIATQGYYYFFTSNYVTKFMVEYENSRTKGFVMYQDLNGEDKIFNANNDGNGIVNNQFLNQPFVARRLRILPTEWYNNINLKVELYRPCVDDN